MMEENRTKNEQLVDPLMPQQSLTLSPPTHTHWLLMSTELTDTPSKGDEGLDITACPPGDD